MSNKKRVQNTVNESLSSSFSEEVVSEQQFEAKEYIESLQYKVEDLESALKDCDEQIALLNKQLKETEESLKNKLEKWQQCSRHYANISFLAHKGFLMTQGQNEQSADQMAQSILKELKCCENI